MHRLFRIAALLLGCSLGISAWGQQGGIAPALVQRIAVADFRFWERQRELDLSRTHDLVIYQLYPDVEPAVSRAIALKFRPDAEALLGYAREVRHAGDDKPLRLRTRKLSPTIARQVRAVFRRLLEYNVYRPTGKPYVGSPNDSWWIFLRSGRTEAIAGTVLHGGLHIAATDDSRAFNGVMDGLIGLFEAPPEEQDRILTELDRLSAVFAQTGKVGTQLP